MLVGYLVFTTALGAKLAGKQATIRDFFLGGRKLPWPAVTGSIIATEISAVTFLGAPAIVFAAGGDFTYLQLALGAILARVIIGVWFVPAFYEREIYSPYDYMGHRLGTPVRSVTTGLFMLGAVLGQSVRVLLTALVLELMTGLPLGASIWIIGVIAVAWTLLGGITTVIWTDVVQFVVFAIGIVAALVFVCSALPGGWREVVSVADAAGKFRFWNLSSDPNVAFTLWAALIANTVLCLNSYGTDQLVAQRMFCCRGPREARIAIIASSVGQLVTVAALLVGVGLFAYYQHNPLTGQAADLVAERGDRIFPVFILQRMPNGLKGLIIAGVFAAAISSLDSVLAALSQTVISGFYRPWRQRGRDAALRARSVSDGSHRARSVSDGSHRARSVSDGSHRARSASDGSHRARSVSDGSYRARSVSDGSAAVLENQATEESRDQENPRASARSVVPPQRGTGEGDSSAEDRHYVFASRLLVVAWAIVLCAMAQVTELALARYGDILNLALAMASFTGGAMLAAFCLALFKLNVDHRGVLWSAPLSVLTVFAITWHQPWALVTTIVLAVLILGGWTWHLFARPEDRSLPLSRDVLGTAGVALAGAMAVFLCWYRLPSTGDPLTVAWPWNVPIGFAVAFTLGYLLARPRHAST